MENMMVRCVCVCVVLLASLPFAGPAEAQCWSHWDAFWYGVALDWQRNNCWPSPFIAPDRQAVRAPFVLMVHNGWRRQNLVADHHFDEGTATLNNAGQWKVRWIMTEAPRQHRTLYVRRAETPEKTAARVAAVEEYAARFAEEGEAPRVQETHINATGWPAVRVDMIDRRWIDSAPDPRLPSASGGSGESD